MKREMVAEAGSRRIDSTKTNSTSSRFEDKTVIDPGVK
jgi:hypothetical protein